MKPVAILLSFLCYFFSTISYSSTPSLSELRSQFNYWQNNYRSLSISEQKKNLDSLQYYPLYPYAEYQYLSQHFDTLTPKEVNQFFAQNKNTPISIKLMQKYVEHLAEQKDWKALTSLNIDDSIASRCRYQYALLMQNKKESAFKPIKNIWLSGHDLPTACDPIFDEWGKAGKKTANLILLRVVLALDNNNIDLARYLTIQLPYNYKTVKENLLALYDNPATLSDFAKNIYPSSFSKKIVTLSFNRFARQSLNKAKSAIPTLVRDQKLSESDKNAFFTLIASGYTYSSATEEEAKWRDAFIIQHQNIPLIEQQIRLALRSNNIDGVEYWLNVLPEKARQKKEWQYWQAIILKHHQKEDEANAILDSLAEQRGFYAMYSAQKRGLPYSYPLDYRVITKAKSDQEELKLLQQKYEDLPSIKRINELRFWNMLPEATKEWHHYLYSNTHEKQYAELARYAYYQNWGQHSVQATIAGKLWNNWVERFPVVHKDAFNKSLENKPISLSYAIAIARQESGLNPVIQSPAGARGLMQLMPGTAKDSAKKIPSLNYHSTEQLYDPEVNIQLGAYYLGYTYQLFDNNRILASAAYNAGPARVSRWLEETNNQLDAIAFIESIPFAETRNYVKNVLVYRYIYDLILGNEPNQILSFNEINQKY